MALYGKKISLDEKLLLSNVQWNWYVNIKISWVHKRGPFQSNKNFIDFIENLIHFTDPFNSTNWEIQKPIEELQEPRDPRNNLEQILGL